MKPLSVFAVGIAAVAGALAWAAIAYYLGRENAWIALIIGAAVGFGASVTGSRGPVSGIMCAVFALASIFAGKMFAAQWSIAHYADSEEIRTTLEEGLASELNEDAFAEYS